MDIAYYGLLGLNTIVLMFCAVRIMVMDDLVEKIYFEVALIKSRMKS